MITNCPRVGIEILNETITFTFYLTGSRFFGGWKPDSDWDFFAEDSPEVREFLVDNGFVPESLRKYATANAVYVHLLKGLKVHVQLERNVDAKIAAQEMLRPFLIITPKMRHASLWNAAMNEVERKDK